MTFTLKADHLYEFAFLGFDAAGDPLDAYLGDLADEARQAGAAGVALLSVTHVEHADFDAQSVAIVEWPSAEAHAAFHGRATWPAAVLAGRNAVAVTVETEATVALRRDGRYEFAAFWMNRTNAALNGQYFEAMGPRVRDAAPRPLASLQVAQPVGPLALNPTRFNLLEWTGTPEARDALFTSQEFTEAGYLRALALDRMATIMVAP
ncbi:MAG: hypothetical protein AAF311_12645 [Pseudomonadota bacterium]